MEFNFISDNLSLFSCILVKESLISLYNKSYGINNRNNIIVISCFFIYISVKEDTLHWILFDILKKKYCFINDHSTKIILSTTICLFY